MKIEVEHNPAFDGPGKGKKSIVIGLQDEWSWKIPLPRKHYNRRKQVKKTIRNKSEAPPYIVGIDPINEEELKPDLDNSMTDQMKAQQIAYNIAVRELDKLFSGKTMK